MNAAWDCLHGEAADQNVMRLRKEVHISGDRFPIARVEAVSDAFPQAGPSDSESAQITPERLGHIPKCNGPIVHQAVGPLHFFRTSSIQFLVSWALKMASHLLPSTNLLAIIRRFAYPLRPS